MLLILTMIFGDAQVDELHVRIHQQVFHGPVDLYEGVDWEAD